MVFLCVTDLASRMLPTPGRVVLGGESGNRFGSRMHVARERPEVSVAGLRHEQWRRDAVLAQMGQRTVAELVQCPLPFRSFTEQRPRPLVGEPPPAVRASIQLGRNDVGPTRGHKERTAASTGQVTEEEPSRRRSCAPRGGSHRSPDRPGASPPPDPDRPRRPRPRPRGSFPRSEDE